MTKNEKIAMVPLCLIILIIICINIVLLSGHQEYKEIEDRKNINFAIDSAFTSDEVVEIKSVLKKWETKTDVHLTSYIRDISIREIFSFASDDICTIYKANSWWNWKKYVIKYIVENWAAVGAAIFRSGDIFIMYNSKHFNSIITHEVGHILIGKEWHSKDINSIMNQYLGGSSQQIKMEEINLIKSGDTK
jgi:hypothetical protein